MGRCPEKQKPGGCTLHNLHCRFPQCDEQPTDRAGWIRASDRLPRAGQKIVKRWKSGSMWAGVYSGSDKDSSFDDWFPLED